METKFEIFVDHWHQIAYFWSLIALGIGALIFSYYILLVTIPRSASEKYRFYLVHEIKFLWYTALSLVVSFTFFLNGFMVKRHHTGENFDLIVKTAISLGIGFAIGYALNIFLSVYYPSLLEKKLTNLRFKKRISPKTNKEMRLLNEDEEDVHLTDQMIAEEEAYAFDYDVWLDEETGYKLIEKYNGNLHALICNHCRFRTLKEVNEEVIASPTEDDDGILRKHYKCSYCGHSETRDNSVAYG